MLESRGAVYRRERSARFEAHDGCSCTAEPVWRKEADPPEVVALREDWQRVTGHIPDRKGKARAWAKYWRERQATQVGQPAASPPAAIPPRGRLTLTDVSIEKAREELADQLADVQRLAERGASARAVISTMRSRMRRLRIDPVDAAGNPLAGTSPTPAVRYIWRRPGGDVDLSGPEPTGWSPGELEEFRIARQMARIALAVEREALAGGSITDAAAAARM